VRALAEEAGVECEELVVFGRPEQTILSVAEEVGADPVFLGAEGMSRLEHAFIGSVSDRGGVAPCEQDRARSRRVPGGGRQRGGGVMSAPPFPLRAWLVFVGLVLALLFLDDLFVLHRNAREVPFKEAMWPSGFWIAFSLAFRGFVWYLASVGGAEAYLAAYLLEKSLSVDNLSVFSVIFTSFAVPERDRYHVLFYGVIGAIVFRAIFVLSGTVLLSAFTCPSSSSAHS
jgi:hypothetical protein